MVCAKGRHVKIRITYCTRWNYLPRATSLAAAIEAQTGVRPELVGGGSGVFDVDVDGARLFSKHEAGRFPDDEEILERLA